MPVRTSQAEPGSLENSEAARSSEWQVVAYAYIMAGFRRFHHYQNAYRLPTPVPETTAVPLARTMDSADTFGSQFLVSR